MSLDLLNCYEKDFESSIQELKLLLDDHTMVKALGRRNPYEYEKAQNFLKQMEIETMNYIENNGGPTADKMRTKITKHKKDFEVLRREMRQLQQKFEREEIEAMSKLFDQAEEKINGDIEDRQADMLMQQRESLKGAKAIGEECVTLASEVKCNLKGQGEQLESAHRNLFQL